MMAGGDFEVHKKALAQKREERMHMQDDDYDADGGDEI